MQVHVETDNHVEGREKLIEHVETVIRSAVGHFEGQVTHVEAHLGDVNGSEKSGADGMRCLMEARVAGLKNTAVKHQAENLHVAIQGAADKLKKALESALGKAHARERRHAGTGELSADVARELDDGVPPLT
ncbi:HPF/RaiA family ribosome-associated protein [Roseateles sp. P5_E7]